MGQMHTCRGRATSVIRDNAGALHVTYHQTEVVTVFANGVVKLDSGGYRTFTTKARMNQASNQFGLGFGVFQDKHEWYVRVMPDGTWDNGRTLPFEDGMLLGSQRKMGALDAATAQRKRHENNSILALD